LAELLTKKSTGWYSGCGCGQKASDLVVPPVGSVELFMTKSGAVTGVSGIIYEFTPNTISIDITPQDAAEFRKSGIALDPRPGLKGVLTRKV
jgi:hypothetical protein